MSRSPLCTTVLTFSFSRSISTVILLGIDKPQLNVNTILIAIPAHHPQRAAAYHRTHRLGIELVHDSLLLSVVDLRLSAAFVIS
ncbi:MAG: hypothetical protein L6Q38_17240, partial [Nitrospira sp.]|nr:hypothetical protein [Nitrospira sp.]